MKPEISIITATYNRAYILPDAINSVRNQSFENWEHIIVDDGSADNTVDVVADFMKVDPRIKYIKLEKNSGQGNAMNKGIEEAITPLIAFIDSDDELHPEYLKNQISFFNNHPETGLCYVGADYYSNNKRTHTVHPQVSGNLEKFLFTNLKGLGSSSSITVREFVFNKAGYFDTVMPSQKDLDFLVRVARLFPIGYIDNCNTIMRSDSDNRISDNAKSIIEGEIIFINKYESRIKELGLYHHVARKLARKYALYQKNLPMAYRYLLKSIKSNPTYLYAYLYAFKLPILYLKRKI